MIDKTRGIVIHYLKYQETSIIVKIFTEEYGLLSFIVNGIRSSKSKQSIGYFQPFSLLDLVIYLKQGREIQRLSEYKRFKSTPSLAIDIRKGTIVLFLSEILGRVLHQEQGQQHALFDFISEMIIALDEQKQNIQNFHLHFLIHLTTHLGIGIEDGDQLIESMERESATDEKKAIQLISKIYHADFDENIDTSGKERLKALDLIIEYYGHHGLQIGEIKSLKVLHEVFM